MKILGIDTTSKFLCLGASDGVNIYEYNLELGIKQSALLIPTIKRVLAALKWQVGEIDCFALAFGPGSFTGMRVGISAVKGLSWSLEKPILGISSLDILAMNAVALDVSVIAPVVDAKRGLVYSSVYRKDGFVLERTAPYMLLAIDECIKKINGGGLNKLPAVILGDAVALYKEEMVRKAKNAQILDRDYWYPKAGNIIRLALERQEAGKMSNAFDIAPIYLYPKECQIKSHQGHRGHQLYR